MSTDIQLLADDYAALRQASDEIAKQLEEAEQALIEAMLDQSVKSIVRSGRRITYVNGSRPNYNAELLRELVSAATFKKVTKTVVDVKKFKAAVDLNTIQKDVADSVTTLTNYESLRVTTVNEDDSITIIEQNIEEVA